MNRPTTLIIACASLVAAAALAGDEAPLVLTNHLGYEQLLVKRAIVRTSGVAVPSLFVVKTYPEGEVAFRGQATPSVPVDRWKSWRFAELEFSGLQREGTYLIECTVGTETVRSWPFRIQRNLLERHTLTDVLAYFKSQRCSGALDRADRTMTFLDGARAAVDVHGGWYDATGDYGKHLSHLSFSTFFNPQQTPLVVYSLLKTHDLLLARGDNDFTQFRRRILDEAAYGADFLVRMKSPNGSFYQSVSGRGPGKKPEDRRITPAAKAFVSKVKKPTEEEFARGGGSEPPSDIFEVSYRGGGGMAIAALALAARYPNGGDFEPARYLAAAEAAFSYLEQHNVELCNDGRESIVDDITALIAASELYRTTRSDVYGAAARQRADALLARLYNDGSRTYWRADDRDRPFFHAADAGLPLIALLAYLDLADQANQARIRATIRHSLEAELAITGEVANPFGLARQYVQEITGTRRSSFFYPHNTETAPWWQGENARLGSLSAAARLAAPLYSDDPAFQLDLQRYALDQLDWVLGRNPFDACMLDGAGHNNPEYMFFGSYQYANVAGGICNGITAGYKDEHDIDFNLLYESTGKDDDWRWGEQWLPHASWYMLAVAAGGRGPEERPKPVVIGYIFPEDEKLRAEEIRGGQLTHVNYAFADIRNGRIAQGFRHDPENFKVLNGLKAKNPALKVLISVGGWTWSGNFSDMALTARSRARFVTSAIEFVRRHSLDGIDIDWEYPSLPGYGNTHRPEDKHNFTLLLAELRAALDREGAKTGTRYLLTIAAGAVDDFLDSTEMAEAARFLDYVNLMTYDQFESSFDRTTGHHAPLFLHPDNPKGFAASTMVDRFVAAGVPPEKIVIGLAFYGRSWGEVGPAGHGLYQPGSQPNVHVNTSFSYLAPELENKAGFVRYWDDLSKAPYLYNAERRLWITYDDPQSVAEKCRYVLGRGLAGVMFWQYTEDFEGRLLATINRELGTT
jgi:GH18 family chitinase